MTTDERNQSLVTSDNPGSTQRSLIKVISRFLGGALLGMLVLLIPFTYGEFNNFGLVQVGVAFALIIFCGLLTVLWGEKFIDTVTGMLNGTAL